jgi:hypothetical protein
MPPQVIPVDSNSTRTESSVAIRPDPIARVPVDVPKAADHNGYQQITRPSREMEAGLKILCASAFAWLAPSDGTRQSQVLAGDLVQMPSYQDAEQEPALRMEDDRD